MAQHMNYMIIAYLPWLSVCPCSNTDTFYCKCSIDLIRPFHTSFTRNICIWLHKSISAFRQTLSFLTRLIFASNQMRLYRYHQSHSMLFVIHWPNDYWIREFIIFLLFDTHAVIKLSFFCFCLVVAVLWAQSNRIRKFRQSFLLFTSGLVSTFRKRGHFFCWNQSKQCWLVTIWVTFCHTCCF